MVLTPDQPFPKTRGHAIRSKDWNDAIGELQRLDTAKVNKAGDSLTGPLTISGTVGIGTTNPQHGRLMIEDASVPLSLRETGQSLIAGGLWRMPLDGGVLRFEVNTSGAGDFTTFISPLAMRADGNVSFGGRVGIGTTAPNEELDVVGDIFLRGSLRFPNAATPMMFIYESGFQNQSRVVIAHSPAAPTQGLHYRDTDDKMFFRFSENSLVSLTVDLSLGRVGVLTDSPSFPLHVVGDAFKTTGTAWTTSSDERLKKRISQLNGVLGRLSRLRGVSFEWQKPEEHGNLTGTQMGLVAQEVEEVFPEWVDANPDGYKTLTLRGFEALTVEAFKELVAENETLKAKSNKLEDRIKDLELSTFGDAGGIDATEAAQRRAGELGVRLSDVKGTGAGGCALVQDIEEAAKG
jgi:pyruvate/2-oxoglutarate dehydrogenase complex dihydrolipoamide acyltransferase (E2) component